MSIKSSANANHNDVAQYQVGAIPFVTSSLVVPASNADPLVVKFPMVSQFVTVRCDSDGALRMGFSSNGVKGVSGNNYLVLSSSVSFTGGFRLAKVFLLSNNLDAQEATVIAGLTPVDSAQVDGGQVQNWSGSIGVG